MPKTPNIIETTGETVTVALKHPTGIVIQAQVEYENHEPVMGGGTRPVKVWRGAGKQYTLNGNAFQIGDVPNCLIVAGYAMTLAVPKDVWENWLKLHPDHPLVESGLIYANERSSHAEGHAKDGAELRSGLEPIMPNTDPRIDRRRNRDGKIVPVIETGMAA